MALCVGAFPVGTATAAGTAPAIIKHVGRYPDALAADPISHDVYVADRYGGALSVIDGSGDASNDTVVATVPVRSGSDAVAVDPSTEDVYVTNATVGRGVVQVIDGAPGAEQDKVVATVPVGLYPVGVAVDPTTHVVYVANSFSCTVSVISTSPQASKDKVVASIPVESHCPPGNLNAAARPTAIAVDPSTHEVFVSTYGSHGTVAVIDGSADVGHDTLVATVPVRSYASSVAVDAMLHEVYVTDNGGVQVIAESTDPANDAVDATISAHNGQSSLGFVVAVDPVTHDVYVPGANLTVIHGSRDATNDIVVQTSTLGDGTDNVDAIGVDTANHELYAANVGESLRMQQVLTFGGLGAANLSLTVTGPASAGDGSAFTENVRVANAGPSAAPRTATSLFVPAGLTVTSAPGATSGPGTNPLVWNDPSVAAHTSITHTVTFSVAPDAGATVTLGGATVVSDGYDPDPADNVSIARIRLGSHETA